MMEVTEGQGETTDLFHITCTLELPYAYNYDSYPETEPFYAAVTHSWLYYTP